MQRKLIETPNGAIAVFHSDTPCFTDGQSALEFAVNAGASCIVLNKEALSEDFFKLSTGVAGEVVQKFVNYGYRLVVVGDFSQYTSKPLHDYLFECNNGRQLNFVATEAEAVQRLSG